jgi:peptidoglycan/xylan/chitin deacetylase (PgdA/CDA1 family)
VILLYHRVAEPEHDPLSLSVSPANFAEQLDVVRDTFGAATLQEVAEGSPGVAITVDDGYADSLHTMLPALRRAGVPATLFVSTGHVAAGRAFWWDVVPRLLDAAPDDAGPLLLTLDGDTRAWPARTANERDEARRHLHAWLQARSPEDIASALRAIATWAGAAGDPLVPVADERPLTLEELRRLATDGFITIAAHGRSHRSLASTPPEARREEIAGSGDDLARWLGSQPRAFSYPFGVPGTDVDQATAETVRSVGYELGVANAPGLVGPASDRFVLPRFVAKNTDGDAFAAWLQRLPG